MMSITEMMNYRYENPDIEVEVDTKIAEKFTARERENENVENFALWGSMSSEASKIENMINAYKNQLSENVINKTI